MLTTKLTYSDDALFGRHFADMIMNIVSKLRLIGDIIEIPITLSTGDKINIIRVFYENAKFHCHLTGAYVSQLSDVKDRKSILYEEVMKDCLFVGISTNITLEYDIINGYISFEMPRIGDIISDILVDCDYEYDLELNTHGDIYLWKNQPPGCHQPLWFNMRNERNFGHVDVKITLKSFVNDENDESSCFITFGAVNVFDEKRKMLLRENLFLADNEAIVINK